MAILRLSLSPAESEVVLQIEKLTGLRRTQAIRSALTAYRWLLQQAVTGATILARKPSGEEVTLVTPEVQLLEGMGRKLSPKELGWIARRLEKCTDSTEAGELKEQMARGFYGI